ncbi:DUF4145 domain-containing protein [Myroides odoratimimus]|uniref:DUF4145 domain-containing protein n=1 Tax=Myroides odoratimimus TaxID=76832 RepID=UPI0025758D11|nr:DUF4145 domain-containing protein [Myroides odoratimimus]MDM1497150.1 DUF4145 domain-containing protein [Myroides odoratimimus]
MYQENDIVPSENILRNEQGDQIKIVYTIIAELWSLSRCKGCENKNFKHIIRQSNDVKHDHVYNFPHNPIRQVPKWIINLPIQYIDVLLEVYRAINNKSFILALIGLRTVLDIYIVIKIGDIGTFKQKLQKLVDENIITNSKAKVLEIAINAGNASTHRGFKPEIETLIQILDIIENLLHSEIIDRSANEIKEKTPSRT